jgi:DNA-binding transcriptional LysR family regulator
MAAWAACSRRSPHETGPDYFGHRRRCVEILLKLLRDRKLDMVLCMRPNANDHDNDFYFEPLFTDTMLLVAGKNHPAARARRPSTKGSRPDRGAAIRDRLSFGAVGSGEMTALGFA